ncbi:hypothetical protein PR003_g9078 [Phytophthora rubi]|uniref:Uncharacterized protein n=1 Tax=Phytophthora rubi TaxID=129364 RepID=A0A6A3J5R2_9STRA|nr:hypothetical protein PR001_g22497 [Phytophthora rubi]KAE9032982.1 hypothetical protein PR002_g8903 [Phytophthora rubi]KAE9343277.1 hypothetical protein PR003_g9078 [Phytophthora rubi]
MHTLLLHSYYWLQYLHASLLDVCNDAKNGLLNNRDIFYVDYTIITDALDSFCLH